MGVIPMKEEDGVQEIYTRDHGVVKVKKNSWQDGGCHIVLSPNGAYQHMSGLPIKNEAEIEAAFGENNGEAKGKCLHWFKNRHDQLVNPPRPIIFHSDGYPMFDDGSMPDFDDLYDFFKPGPILTAGILALQRYNERKGQAPKELRKAKAPEAEEVSESMKSQQATPAPNPLKYSPKARGEAKAKAKRAAARAAKAKVAKTTQSNEAPAQV